MTLSVLFATSRNTQFALCLQNELIIRCGGNRLTTVRGGVPR